MRLLFATDIHGSEVCWRKFLNARSVYEPDAMIIGGDITGKVLVPIVTRPDGSRVGLTNYGEVPISDDDHLRLFEREIADVGSYTHRMTEGEYEAAQQDERLVDAMFHQAVLDRVESWMELAAERMDDSTIPLFVSGGNDDYWEVDDVLRAASRVACPDRDVVPLGEYEMLSFGAANQTPWDCPRDMDEDDLRSIYTELEMRLSGDRPVIFNLHVPPYNTALDEAAMLDENLRPRAGMTGAERASVGSVAVREAIEEVQPLLSLHGHVHESRASTKIGKSTALNPGSEYSQGLLRAVVVDLKGAKVRRHQFICG
jgi:Icc-related predicted phosphoesterase